MRAAWYDRQGPAHEVLQIGDIERPVPGPGEALVRVHASGVNPSDCNGRAGRFGRKMGFPRVVPHNDGAGVLAEVGPGVEPALIGRRVWMHNAARGGAMGSAAEYIALDVRLLAELPDDCDFTVGASLGIPAQTAHLCLLRDGPIDGSTVLVTGGAGAVGFYAIQIAKWAGARVIATVSSERKARDAALAGADLVLNYRSDDVAEAVLGFTDGRGVDRIVEVDFGANLPTTLRVLADNAVVSMYSSVGVPEPRVPALGLMFKGATVRFVQLGLSPLQLRQAAQRGVVDWLKSGRARHRIAISVPLERIAEAHDLVESGDRLGTVVVTP
ncbi:MAG: NADPH:quinone reductase [Reyranella sp.]|nr:NADPH:quinone reductase [Reyranella sp.]MBL6650553.1 NADPH:quinone reductase [Reyranella sp.]